MSFSDPFKVSQRYKHYKIERKANYFCTFIHIMKSFNHISITTILHPLMFSSIVDELDYTGSKPLLDLIKQVGGWPLLGSSWDESQFQWEELYVVLREMNVKPLMDISVGTDNKDSTKHVITVRKYIYQKFIFHGLSLHSRFPVRSIIYS